MHPAIVLLYSSEGSGCYKWRENTNALPVYMCITAPGMKQEKQGH